MRMDVIFFFKQKTAYEMRISDWSSDVCSSDLCESEAQANPRSAGEREPSITAALALAALREALRIETFGIPPVLGVAMHRIRAQHYGCPGGDHGIADAVLADRPSRNRPHGREQPHRFLEDHSRNPEAGQDRRNGVVGKRREVRGGPG